MIPAKPYFTDRIAYWIVLASPFWLIRMDWFNKRFLPLAGRYAYYEDQTND